MQKGNVNFFKVNELVTLLPLTLSRFCDGDKVNRSRQYLY
jgi:hypothetical protein